MAYRVAVKARRIEPAHQICASLDRSIEQLSGSGTHQQAALWKRDDLDVDLAGQSLARLEHALDPGEPDLDVDVDMGSHMRCSGGNVGLEDASRALGDRRQRTTMLPLVRDQRREAGAGAVRPPRLAPQGLVHVRVPVDEARE